MILYGVEISANISCVENKLRVTEQNLLKSILKVKKGTSNGLIIYNELKRGDVIAKIKDRQWNFYNRLSQLGENNALVISFSELCKNTNIAYYSSLHNHNSIDNICNRENQFIISITWSIIKEP